LAASIAAFSLINNNERTKDAYNCYDENGIIYEENKNK
jgi:hypothetical protein